VLCSSLVSGDEASWQQVKVTSDGIVVYARETPGATVRELKASLTIDAPPWIVLDAACDPETFRMTSKKYVEQSDIYRTANPNVWHNYQLVNFPLVARRDYTLRYERKMAPQQGLYRLVWRISDEYGKAPKEGVVRVTLANGQIDIKPLDGGLRSTLRYTLLADPGGNIPVWAINLANRVSLPALIREIRDEAQRRAGFSY
jgi:hypothetical protein